MKKTILSLLMVLALFSLTGCFKKVEDTEDQTPNDNTTKVINVKYANQVLGTEEYNVKLNGKDVLVKVEYTNYPEKTILVDEMYYITYKVYVNDKFDLDASGRIYLDKQGMKKIENYNGKKFTYFENTLTRNVIKGKDNKEYIAVYVPAGKSINNKSLLIYNDEGTLLGGLNIDNSMNITLSGKNNNKYKSDQSYNLFYISGDIIHYLAPTDEMYKSNKNNQLIIDESKSSYDFDEFIISVENNKLSSNKTGDSYKGTRTNDSNSLYTVFYIKD